jgi:hypothetical protein
MRTRRADVSCTGGGAPPEKLDDEQAARLDGLLRMYHDTHAVQRAGRAERGECASRSGVLCRLQRYPRILQARCRAKILALARLQRGATRETFLWRRRFRCNSTLYGLTPGAACAPRRR